MDYKVERISPIGEKQSESFRELFEAKREFYNSLSDEEVQQIAIVRKHDNRYINIHGCRFIDRKV